MTRPANGKGSRHRLGSKKAYDKGHDVIKWPSRLRKEKGGRKDDSKLRTD